MSHLDDDAVASLATGDDADAAAARHAVDCPECADRVTHLRSLADRLGTLEAPSELLTPPALVWDQIVDELGDELRVAPGVPTDDPATASADAAAQPPVDLSERRAARDATASRRTPWLVGIAAGIIGLVAGAGIVAGALRNPEPSGDVVAQAALVDLATEAEAGTARVEVLEDGSEVLVLDTDFVDVPDGYLEVWLIDPNIEGMVSLGHLTGANDQFVIPEGFDVAEFPIVDISVEPLDGVPTHSGDSVTRGVLES